MIFRQNKNTNFLVCLFMVPGLGFDHGQKSADFCLDPGSGYTPSAFRILHHNKIIKKRPNKSDLLFYGSQSGTILELLTGTLS